MSRHIKLAAYLTVEELAQGYRQARDGTERSHWQIIWLLAQGHRAVKVAEMTGYSAYWIGQLARRYNAGGPDALRDYRHQARHHRPALLPDAEALAALRAVLTTPAPQGDIWNSRTVAAWLSARVGRPVSATTAWVYLRKLGWTAQAPRPRHVQAATPEQQEGFKKNW